MSVIQNISLENEIDELTFKLQLLFYYTQLLMKSLDEQTQLLYQIEVQKSELEELEKSVAVAEAQKDVDNNAN